MTQAEREEYQKMKDQILDIYKILAKHQSLMLQLIEVVEKFTGKKEEC